ncbi:MAG: NAD(P)-dependent alcohol dehydrogenase [Actinomycetota bacterium]
MRAAVCRAYGPPEVVGVEEVPDPVFGADELLIRVTSSTVNRTTSCIRACIPAFAARPMYGFRRPRRPILGTDFAGVVEAVGHDVDGFAIGDRVFGFDDRRLGGHGELLALPVAAGVLPIPDGVPDDTAAAAVEGGYYALGYIERADLASGQRALVHGGGGTIGTTAIQLLVAAGVEVVAVAEEHQRELMADLGAAQVIDYRSEDFTAIGETFDLVFDAVGKTSFHRCRPLLPADGMFMATELGPRLQNIRLSLTTRFGGGPRVHFPIPGKVRPQLKKVAAALEDGSFKPVIDRTFHLDQIVDAYRYVDTESKTGNVILRVGEPLVPSPGD